jgi:hypothetical protein
MVFSAVSSSNILKLGGCLHPSLTHNVVKPFLDSSFVYVLWIKTNGAIWCPFLKTAKTSSIWVSNERSRPRE